MNSQPANTAKLKSVYKAPQLLVYGGMAETTASGSKGDAEMGNPQGNGQGDRQRT